MTGAYIGTNVEVPIYEGEVANVTTSNISTYFTVTNGTRTFTGSGGTWKASNTYSQMTHTITLTAKKSCTLSFSYAYTLYGGKLIGGGDSSTIRGTYTITAGGTTILSAAATTSNLTSSGTWSGAIAAGTSMVFSYYNGSGIDTSTYYAQFSGVTADMSVRTGTEIKADTARKIADIYIGVNGAARKVVKGYIGVNGVARLWHTTGVAVTITGAGSATYAYVVINGTTYTRPAALSLPPGTVISCYVSRGATTSSGRSTITVNGTTVASTSRALVNYDYTAMEACTIALSCTSISGTVAITTA